MGLSSKGSSKVLQAGQTESFVVQLRVPLRPERISVSLSSVGAVPTDGSQEPIDWESLKEDVRPRWLGEDGWEPVWQNLIDQVGSTWGDYSGMLNENVVYLGQFGQTERDTRELLGFELRQADALSPLHYLASSRDASIYAPGMPLEFVRAFAQPCATSRTSM